MEYLKNLWAAICGNPTAPPQYVADTSVLPLGPDDVLVVELPESDAPMEKIKTLTEHLVHVFGKEQKIVVLPFGMVLRVVKMKTTPDITETLVPVT